MKNSSITFLILISLSTFGQDIKKIEEDLLTQFKKVHYWTDHRYDDKVNGYDSLTNENEIFNQKLLNYTSKQPLTLAYDFKGLQKENLIIVSSADKKFRIYSWDTGLGGTMHDFKNLYQYQANNTYSKNGAKKNPISEAGKCYSEIFTLDINKRKVYMGYFQAIYSNEDTYQAVKLFEIKNNSLNDSLELIKIGLRNMNELGFDFNFSSVANRKERPVKLIYYDGKTKTIKIPVIDGNGSVTNSFISYQFTGQYFEKK